MGQLEAQEVQEGRAEPEAKEVVARHIVAAGPRAILACQGLKERRDPRAKTATEVRSSPAKPTLNQAIDPHSGGPITTTRTAGRTVSPPGCSNNRNKLFFQAVPADEVGDIDAVTFD